MKRLPNIISLVRIGCAGVMFIATGPVWAMLYLVCGLTDVLDGFLARRLGAVTALGARLDSVGDVVFWLAVVWALWRAGYAPGVLVWSLIGLVGAVRVASFVVGLKSFRRAAFVHTLANKAAGLGLYIALPLVLVLPATGWLVWPVGALTLLAAVEELVILATAKRFEPDRRGLFC